MKTLAIVIILLLLALLAIAVWPARYDYRALAVPEAQFRSVMDSLGADGWELVAARKQSNASPSSFEVVLKRRKGFLVSDRHSSNAALAKMLAAKDDSSPATPAASEHAVTAT